MELVYKCAGEILKLDLDRATKQLKVASSKTNYSFIEMPWSSLFDKGKEQAQENITNILNDAEFCAAITEQMKLWGYKRVV